LLTLEDTLLLGLDTETLRETLLRLAPLLLGLDTETVRVTLPRLEPPLLDLYTLVELPLLRVPDRTLRLELPLERGLDLGELARDFGAREGADLDGRLRLALRDDELLLAAGRLALLLDLPPPDDLEPPFEPFLANAGSVNKTSPKTITTNESNILFIFF
jgi:hypothetical protein